MAGNALIGCFLLTIFTITQGLKCPSHEEPSKKIVCYYEGKTNLDDLNLCNCTHLVFNNIATVENFNLTFKQDVLLAEKKIQGIKNLILILTVNLKQDQTSSILKSEEKKISLLNSISTFLRTSEFSGIELNFEFEKDDGTRKTDLISFVKDLRSVLNHHRVKRDGYSVFEDQKDDFTTGRYSTEKYIEKGSTTKKSKIKRKKNRIIRDDKNVDFYDEDDAEISVAEEYLEDEPLLKRIKRRKQRFDENGEIKEEKTIISKKEYIIMIRLSIIPEIIGKKYDLKGLSKYVDFMMVPTHLMTDESENHVTYHPSRLMGLSDILNTDSIVDLLTGLGAPKSKLIISIPASVFQHTLKDSNQNTVRSPTVGEPSIITQPKMCHLLKTGDWTVERDEDLTAPYAFSKNTWLAFEDDLSVNIKGKYIILRDIAGASVYPIDSDIASHECAHQEGGRISSVLQSNFGGLARKPRQVVLESLQEQIHDTSFFSQEAGVHLSEYRIVRVVDHEGAVHVIRKNTKTQFECSRQGYFSHPLGCNKFYRCVKFNQYTDDYTVFEYDCPDGLAFDERWEVCVWPGSLPHGAPCTGSSEIAPVPRAYYQCPNIEGYYADPENCRWFFACLDHARDGVSPLTAYEFRCPFGLVFDENKLACDWPWLVGGCGARGAAGLVITKQGGASSYQGAAAFSNGVVLEQNRASFATVPDYIISGGRIANKNAGVILNHNIAGGLHGPAGINLQTPINVNGLGLSIGGTGVASNLVPIPSASPSSLIVDDGGSSHRSHGAGIALNNVPIVAPSSILVDNGGSSHRSHGAALAVNNVPLVTPSSIVIDDGGYGHRSHGAAFAVNNVPHVTPSSYIVQDGGSSHLSHGAGLVLNNVPIGTPSGVIVDNGGSSHRSHGAGFAFNNVPVVTPSSVIVDDGGSSHRSHGAALAENNVPLVTPSSIVIDDGGYGHRSHGAAFAVNNVPHVTPSSYIVEDGGSSHQSHGAGLVLNNIPIGTPSGIIVDNGGSRHRSHGAGFAFNNIPVVTPSSLVVEDAGLSHNGNVVHTVEVNTPRPLVYQQQNFLAQQKIVSAQPTVYPVYGEKTFVQQPATVLVSPKPEIYQTSHVLSGGVQRQQLYSQKPQFQDLINVGRYGQGYSYEKPAIAFELPSKNAYLPPVHDTINYQEPKVYAQNNLAYNEIVQHTVTPKPSVLIQSQPIVQQQLHETVHVVQQNVYQQPLVVKTVTQRPIIYQRPAVSLKPVFYQKEIVTPKPIVFQQQISTPTPVIYRQEVINTKPIVYHQEISPIVTPKPILYQQQYVTPKPRPQVYQQIVTPAPIAYQKEHVVYEQQQIITPKPVIYQQQQVIAKPVVYQTEVKQPIIYQQQPVIQKVEYEQIVTPKPVVYHQEVISHKPVVYQQQFVTPKPVVYQQQVVTPKPVVYQQEIISPQPVVYQQQYVTPKPVVYQQQVVTPKPVVYQQEILSPKPVVYQQQYVTPKPVVYQQQYVTPKPVVYQQQVVTPKPVVYQQEILSPKPVVYQQQYVTPKPVVYQQEIISPKPVVYQQQYVTPKPVVYQQQVVTPKPIVYQQEIIAPKPVVYQQQYVTPKPVVYQQQVVTPKPVVYQQEILSPKPVVYQQQYVTPKPVVYQQEIISPKPVVYQQQYVTPKPVVYRQEIISPKPVVYQQQYVTPKPVVYQQQVVTPKPVVYQQEIISPKPVVYQQQYVTPKPVVYQQQVVTPKPVVYQQEIISPKPVVYQQQYVTPKPVVYQQQAVTPKPVVYQQEIISPKPVVYQQQYVTPKPVVYQQEIISPKPVVYQQQYVTPKVSYKQPIIYQQTVTPTTPKAVLYQQVFNIQPKPAVTEKQIIQPVVYQQKVKIARPITYQQAYVTPKPVVYQQQKVEYQEVVTPAPIAVEQPYFEISTPKTVVYSQRRPAVQRVQEVSYAKPAFYEQKIAVTPKPVIYQAPKTQLYQENYEVLQQPIVTESPKIYQEFITPENVYSQDIVKIQPTVYKQRTNNIALIQTTQRPAFIDSVLSVTPKTKTLQYQPIVVGQIPQYNIRSRVPTTPKSVYSESFERNQGEYQFVDVVSTTKAPALIQTIKESAYAAEEYLPPSDVNFGIKESRIEFTSEVPVVSITDAPKYGINTKIEIAPPPAGYVLNIPSSSTLEPELSTVYTVRPKTRVRVRPVTTTQSSREYLPPVESRRRGKGKTTIVSIGQVDKSEVDDENIEGVLDKYSGKFGDISEVDKEKFVTKIIQGNQRGTIKIGKEPEVSTVGYEITSSRARSRSRTNLRKFSSTSSTSTTEDYEVSSSTSSDDDDTQDTGDISLATLDLKNLKVKKNKKTVIVVSQVSDANPILIGKLAGQCSCQSNQVNLKNKRPSGRRGSKKNDDDGENEPENDNNDNEDEDTAGGYPRGRSQLRSRNPQDNKENNNDPSGDGEQPRRTSGRGRNGKSRGRKPSPEYNSDDVNDPSDSNNNEPDTIFIGSRSPYGRQRGNYKPSDGDNDPENYGYVNPDEETVIIDPDHRGRGRNGGNQPIYLDNVATENGPDTSGEVSILSTSTTTIIPEVSPSILLPLAPRRRPVQVEQDSLPEKPSGRRIPSRSKVRVPFTENTSPLFSPITADEIVGSSGYNKPTSSDGTNEVSFGVSGEPSKTRAGAAFDRYGPGGWRSADETLQGSVDCKRPGLFRHPKYCNKFYSCNYDPWKKRYTLHVFNCPIHLAYDNNLGACNWPSKGPACADDNLLV